MAHRLMRVSAITPTCDRPEGIRLLNEFLARQTLTPDEWIVVDGGQTKSTCIGATQHLWLPTDPGPGNFATNLLVGAQVARGDILVILEDDDWYAPTHLETIIGQMVPDGVLAAGDDLQRYYNVEHRVWRTFNNRGASLCQTAFKRALLPVFLDVVHRLRGHSYGVDGHFWAELPNEIKSLERHNTVVGIKGLPGQKGLGIGHRPTGGWTPDPDLRVLRTWVGPDADRYGAMAYTPPT